MADVKTRDLDFTSRALLYKPRNFKVEAKFQVKVQGLPDDDMVEQYIGMALHNYCHENLGKLEARLKNDDALVDDKRKQIALLAKANPAGAQNAAEGAKKMVATVEQEFQKQAKVIEGALPKVAEAVWKKQVAEHAEYKNFRIKVGLVAAAKITLAVAVAAGGIAASVVTGGTTAVIAVGAVAAGISVLTGAITALKDASKGEAAVRKQLEEAIETLNKEIAKANLRALTGTTKMQKIKDFFKSNPAKKVESLLEEHKKQIIGVRQKADSVHNGVLKLIAAQDVAIKQIKDAKAKGHPADKKLEDSLTQLEKHVDLILKSTESKLDAMANAEKLRTNAVNAVNEAKNGNLDGVGKAEKAVGLMGPFDTGDLGNAVSFLGSVLASLKV